MKERYRRQPGAVSAMELQLGMSISELCSSFPIHQIDIDYSRRAATTAEHGTIHCGQGELKFYLGDYIVEDQYGNLAVYRPDDFKQEFEAVNADGEE